MLRLILLLLFLLTPLVLCGDTVIVNVKGLVCSSCGIGIKVHLNKTQSVKKVVLDIDNQQAVITLHPDKTIQDKQIIAAIHKAGYELGAKGIKRK